MCTKKKKISKARDQAKSGFVTRIDVAYKLQFDLQLSDSRRSCANKREIDSPIDGKI